MSQQKYRELIDQLCEVSGFSDPASRYESCDLQVMGISFSLMHEGDGDEDNLLLFCDYGELPEQNLAAILQVMLEMNAYLFAEGDEHFAINPDTKRVMRMKKIALMNLSVPELLSTMMMLAANVNDWR